MNRIQPVLLLLCVSPALAVTVSGKIVTKGTPIPVFKAGIYVLDSDVKVVSSATGDFTLNLNDDQLGTTVTLLFSRYRYESRILRIRVDQESLKLAPVELVQYEREPDFLNLPNLTVMGRVLDDFGNPLHGVEIFATNTTGHALSTKEGSFRFFVNQIREIDATEIWLHKEGYRSRIVGIDHLKDKNYYINWGQHITLTSLARPSITLVVRFRDPLGVPIRNVKVTLENQPISVTDLLGTVSTTLVDRFNQKVRLGYDYRESRGDTIFLAQGETQVLLDSLSKFVNLRLRPYTPKLVVAVQDSFEKPIASAKVTFDNHSVITDINGEATIFSLTNSGTVRAEAEGFFPREVKFTKRQPEDRAEIVLARIPPPKRFVVTVVDSMSNEPLAGAQVSLHGLTEAHTFLSDTAGAVVFFDPPTPAKLTAEFPGYISKSTDLTEPMDKWRVLLDREPRIVKLAFVDIRNQEALSNVTIRFGNEEQLRHRSDEQGIITLKYFALPDSFIVVKEGFQPKNVVINEDLTVMTIPLEPRRKPRKRDTFQEETGVLKQQWSAQFGLVYWRLRTESHEITMDPGLQVEVKYAREILTKAGETPLASSGYQGFLELEGWPKQFWRAAGGMAVSLHFKDYGFIFIGGKLNGLSTNFDGGSIWGGVSTLVGATFHPKSFPFLDPVYDKLWFPKYVTFDFEEILGRADDIYSNKPIYRDSKNVNLPDEEVEISAVWKTKVWFIQLGFRNVRPAIRLDRRVWPSTRSYYVSYGVTW
jgi:hypothetical protein